MMQDFYSGIDTMNIYRHFKGGYYIVQAIATVEADRNGEQVVIYQSLQDGRVWTRPVYSFIEPVPEDKPNPTGQKLRFEKVTDFNNQLNIVPTEKLIEELFSREDCPAEIKLFDKDRVWRTEYLIGQFKERFISQDNVHEDFFFHHCTNTMEEAVEKLKSLNDPSLSILMRTHVKQDFD